MSDTNDTWYEVESRNQKLQTDIRGLSNAEFAQLARWIKTEEDRRLEEAQTIATAAVNAHTALHHLLGRSPM